MSEVRELAKETASLSVACLSLLWVPPAASAIVPLIALTALGRELWGKCPERTTRAAIETVLTDMHAAGIPEAHVIAARAALAAIPATARLDSATLVTAARSDEGFDAAMVAAILAQVPETPAYDTRALIETALATGLRTCRNNLEFRATLTEALVLDTAKEVGLVLRGIERVETALAENTALARDTHTDLQRLLAGLEGVPRPELNTIAARFGHPGPEGAGLTDLKAFLHDKAQDLARLGQEITALRGLSPRIDNIRGAAESAVTGLRLDEARVLLNEAREIQKDLLRAPLEANATLLERLAEIDLIEGKAQDAFTQFSAAADSFAGIDPLEPVRRRVAYADRLYQHGLRYGGAGLTLAARMSAEGLTRTDRAGNPRLWARLQNTLGNALWGQGNRTGGAEGAALLAQAVVAYRAALEVRTQAGHPVDWASTQNNLGAALWNQGTRTAGAEGAALLAQAGLAYRAALEVWTRAEYPMDWAKALNNLGLALGNQATCTGGAEGAALLAQAVEAYRAALEVWTQAEHPVHWATVQNNLGNTLSKQGTRTCGAEGAALLAQAEEAFLAALEVRTRDAYPVHWATTQFNISEAKFNWSAHEACPDPGSHLHLANEHIEAALMVFDPKNLPWHNGEATTLRDRILAALRELDP